MNIISVLLLALSITVGVLVTKFNTTEKTAVCAEKTRDASELAEPFNETQAEETIAIHKIIIL